ncbi:MAG: ABC transporter permease [Ardenticatenaceae bacterium]|nr:ABC transporter permease [Ardenticatenaceae bacterium]
MLLKYILKNFTRRKVRTILMILSLIVSTGLIVAMSATVETIRLSNVDLIASAVGRFDLAINKKDTSLDPFIAIDEIAPIVQTADPQITAVYPRYQTTVEVTPDGITASSSTLIALDPATDKVGFVDVLEGQYVLGDYQTAVFEDTARNLSLNLGDVIDVAYSFPFPREIGQPELAGASQRRTTQRFTITAIVRQDGLAIGGASDGLIISLADMQAWLELQGLAQYLIATVDPVLYESSTADVAALEVRDVVTAVQTQLGDDYNYNMSKAAALDGAAQAFLLIQALINTYGLISLGVVGLLVHTLVMTNVQEQRRDMAILRILGGQRNLLFALVILEIIVIGLIGVGLGVVLGDFITTYIIVPLIEAQMMQEGLAPTLQPQVTLRAIWPAIASAFAILIISSLKPAQEAADTKVMHAINPGVADNIQLEDLAELRERNPNGRLFLAGIALMLIFALIVGFQAISAFGGPALEAMFIFLALGLMVLGLGLMFFITTVPFERVVLLIMGLVMPRLTYFARRNVGRGSLRNTLISLLVLFSGVLPSFLATQQAIFNADVETTTRMELGAPMSLRVFTFGATEEQIANSRLKPSFHTVDLSAVAGVEQTVGLTYGYGTRVSDSVGLRSAGATVVGVDGRLNDVLYTDFIEFVGGTPAALDEILNDPGAVVISEGLADYLSIPLGGLVKLTGEGLDHVVNGRVVGIARRIPGFENIGRSRTQAQLGSDILMSLAAFRELTTELNTPLPPPDNPILERVLGTHTTAIPAEEIQTNILEEFATGRNFWPQFVEINLEFNERNQASQRIFLLIMTVISFTTAVFGVFAVIYVTIFARRLEIGMMKAMGMRRRELTGMLIVESITMTLGAALAGIAAGASMGYIAGYGQRILQGMPLIFAMDTTVMPFIVIMVVFASVLGAAFSARRIVKKQAVEILRMQ